MARLIFRVADERFGLPAQIVESILQTPTITNAIGVPAALIGVFNFRGAIVPAVVVQSAQPTDRRHAIVVRIPTFGRLAVLCDWAEDLRIDGEDPIDSEVHIQDVDLVYLCKQIVRESRDLQADIPLAQSPKTRVILKHPNP